MDEVLPETKDMITKILTSSELADKRMKALSLLYGKSGTPEDRVRAFVLLGEMIEEAE